MRGKRLFWGREEDDTFAVSKSFSPLRQCQGGQPQSAGCCARRGPWGAPPAPLLPQASEGGAAGDISPLLARSPSPCFFTGITFFDRNFQPKAPLVSFIPHPHPLKPLSTFAPGGIFPKGNASSLPESVRINIKIAILKLQSACDTLAGAAERPGEPQGAAAEHQQLRERRKGL